ncbi:hypothetical protein Sulac_3593 (plasmid) [Sulfobacillus acidophilus DSM 10332]|uniref:Uncharacterized protein n=1 Tax=Sulfobacillus acidophilus (strain ATCC 700253 / DSM 10332 / NAL) TaxID=679936 RepID=G8U1U3_SULAD|nr:hypothetical protein Sulac_3593 [Sulfobacillus acidophilus DSM 10332]
MDEYDLVFSLAQYHEGLQSIDMATARLLKRRQKISHDLPGLPPKALVAQWAEQCQVSAHDLERVFVTLYHLSESRHRVRPEGFRAFIPLARSRSQDGATYTILSLRQYDNASVVRVTVEVENNAPATMPGLMLDLDAPFRAWSTHGGGSQSWIQQDFVVAPPLPDNVDGISIRLLVKPHPRPPHRGDLCSSEQIYEFTPKTIVF